jgi:hypothetical protein
MHLGALMLAIHSQFPNNPNTQLPAVYRLSRSTTNFLPTLSIVRPNSRAYTHNPPPSILHLAPKTEGWELVMESSFVRGGFPSYGCQWRVIVLHVLGSTPRVSLYDD